MRSDYYICMRLLLVNSPFRSRADLSHLSGTIYVISICEFPNKLHEETIKSASGSFMRT